MPTEDDESKEGLLDEKSDAPDYYITPGQSRISRAFLIPWILSIFLFCTTVLFAWQLHVLAQTSSKSGTYETGFSTDFVSSPPGIPLKIIRKHFTNDLLFNSTSRQLYNSPISPHETTYIGAPSPEIDQAWHDLLDRQYVTVSESEAQQFPPEHRSPIGPDEDQHYYFELSVFHYLHCLNEIRKSLAVDYDYYHSSESYQSKILSSREHIDHCVDQIRQALQCHADLTPVPMLKAKDYGFIIGNGEVHTCRDFEPVREWVNVRWQAGTN